MATQPMAEHVVLQSATLARLPWMETAEVVSRFSGNIHLRLCGL